MRIKPRLLNGLHGGVSVERAHVAHVRWLPGEDTRVGTATNAEAWKIGAGDGEHYLLSVFAEP